MENGVPLSEDCVRAEPYIYKNLEECGENVALLRAYEGNRPMAKIFYYWSKYFSWSGVMLLICLIFSSPYHSGEKIYDGDIAIVEFS